MCADILDPFIPLFDRICLKVEYFIAPLHIDARDETIERNFLRKLWLVFMDFKTNRQLVEVKDSIRLQAWLFFKIAQNFILKTTPSNLPTHEEIATSFVNISFKVLWLLLFVAPQIWNFAHYFQRLRKNNSWHKKHFSISKFLMIYCLICFLS